MSMNRLKVARNLVVWERSPLNLSGWIPSSQHALSSLSSWGRFSREKGSSPVPQGRQGGLLQAVWDDCIPKDPKTSLYFGFRSSSSLLSSEGSSKGVRGLSFCSLCTASVVAITASTNGIVCLGSDSPWARDSGQEGSPLCSSEIKFMPRSGWFLSPSSLRASRKHSNLFPRTHTSNHMP